MVYNILVLSMCFNCISYSSIDFNKFNETLISNIVSIAEDFDVSITEDIYFYDLYEKDMEEKLLLKKLCSFSNGVYFIYDTNYVIHTFNVNYHTFDFDYNGSLFSRGGKIFDENNNEFFLELKDTSFDEIGNFYNVRSSNNIIYCENYFFFQNINNYSYVTYDDASEYTLNASASMSALISYYLMQYDYELLYPAYTSHAEVLGDIITSKNNGIDYTTWNSPYMPNLANKLLLNEGMNMNSEDFLDDYGRFVNYPGLTYIMKDNLGMGIDDIANQNSEISIHFSYENGAGYTTGLEDTGSGGNDRPSINDMGTDVTVYFDCFLIDFVNTHLISFGRPLLVNKERQYGIAYGVYTNDNGYTYLLTNITGGPNDFPVLVNINVDTTEYSTYHLELMSFYPNFWGIDSYDYIPSYISKNSNNNFDINGNNMVATFSTIDSSSHNRIINGYSYTESHCFDTFPFYRKCVLCGHKIFNSGFEEIPGI